MSVTAVSQGSSGCSWRTHSTCGLKVFGELGVVGLSLNVDRDGAERFLGQSLFKDPTGLLFEDIVARYKLLYAVLGELALDELNQLRRAHGVEFDALSAQELYLVLGRAMTAQR